VGNGGWDGAISYVAMAAAITTGSAVAATDTGFHVGGGSTFEAASRQKLIDLAYRSIHEMAVHAKAVITAHYGKAAGFSYFDGCSQGGRQGLAAAQKHPEDFDGIVAGAAGWDQMRAHAWRVALNLVVNKDADSVIPPTKYPMIHAAVLNACDALDGVKDGVIENPQTCRFDYATLLCKAGDAAMCLTKSQVESAKAMTSPLKDLKTGKVLFSRHLMPGSELRWAQLGGSTPASVPILRAVVFRNPTWDYHTMDLSSDIDRADQSDQGVMRSADPDLRPFFNRGGKLLMFHGWNDGTLSPLNSVAYYDAVLTAVGKSAGNSIALFMVPGMNHCRGGNGTDTFDRTTVIQQWVERGERPERIVASHVTNGRPDKTRPLCPYPRVAKYGGQGSTDDAANFSCVTATSPR
jgi:Tannase and feruloyl esterase